MKIEVPGSKALPDWSAYFKQKQDNLTPILRDRKTGEPIWIDRDRIQWRLSDVSDHHLQSIERWLLGRGAEDVPARKRAFNGGWYDVIRDECERRGLELLSDHESAKDESVEARAGSGSAVRLGV